MPTRFAALRDTGFRRSPERRKFSRFPTPEHIMRRIVSILLQNEAGALARVAGLFAARGYNIDSLTVAATHDAAVSRLTLVTRGDDAVIEQILQQSRKLIDVLDIADLTARDHLEVELVIAKL